MSALEASIERRACNLIEEHLGVGNSKLTTPGDSGYPDRIFWMPRGKPVFIEFKRPGEKPTKKQDYIHRQLKGLGYEVHTCNNCEHAFNIVRAALEAVGIHAQSGEVPS